MPINNIDEFMAAIRTIESGSAQGNYQAEGPQTRWGTAKGAYQFIDETWGNYQGYSNALQAPPEVQDQRARELMTYYYNKYGRWDLVAVAWHAGEGTANRAAAGGGINTQDVLGTSTRDYASRALDLMNQEESTFTAPQGWDYPDNPNMNEEFWFRANLMLWAAEQEGIDLFIVSDYRSIEEQERLWNKGIKKYGKEGVRKWVAPPGHSNHNHGLAIDFGGDYNWLRDNAGRFGLELPMEWEPWHVEPAGLRNGLFPDWDPDPMAYPFNPNFPNPTEEPKDPMQLLKAFNNLLYNPSLVRTNVDGKEYSAGIAVPQGLPGPESLDNQTSQSPLEEGVNVEY